VLQIGFDMFEKGITLKPSKRRHQEARMSFFKSAANDLHLVLKHPTRLLLSLAVSVAAAQQMSAGDFSQAALIAALGATVLTFLKARAERRGDVTGIPTTGD
jgi:hypothetical protein